MKLQVVETTAKDMSDSVAILSDHEMGPAEGIDLDYLARLAGEDWGLWRTITMVAGRIDTFASGLAGYPHADLVRRRIATFRDAMDEAPKSRKWRMRAKVGERKVWYRLPEEVEG